MHNIASGKELQLKLAAYRALESVLPRNTLWKVGRFLYQGARRELINHPEFNGEYALLRWLLPRWQRAEGELLFFDVGANFGEWSVRLLRTLGDDASRARLVAFEPAPSQAERAERSLSEHANGARVSLERQAVAATVGDVAFRVTGSETGNSSITAQAGSGSGLTVPCTTLDEFAGSEAVPLRMIKVDTEGNDCNVIEGARALLAQGRVEVLQFEYNWRWVGFGRSLRDVFARLDGTDYSLGALSQQGLEFYDAWHFELERYFETNFVIVRKDVAAELPGKRMRFDSGNVPVRL